VLDVRPRQAFLAHPTVRAANIPLEVLPERSYELPRVDVEVQIADTGPEARAAPDTLTRMGRCSHVVPCRTVGFTSDRYRLWQVPSHLLAAEHMTPARALCLACGAGREAVFLAAAGWNVVAVDILPDAIERGRLLERAYLPIGAPPIQWMVADLRNSLLDQIGQFELMTQFFYSDSGTVERTGRHLAPKGVALVETFSEAHWLSLGRKRPRRLLHRDAWPAAYQTGFSDGLHDGRLTTRFVIRKT
jgi:SAM-dependent methyltransferase